MRTKACSVTLVLQTTMQDAAATHLELGQVLLALALVLLGLEVSRRDGLG